MIIKANFLFIFKCDDVCDFEFNPVRLGESPVRSSIEFRHAARKQIIRS